MQQYTFINIQKFGLTKKLPCTKNILSQFKMSSCESLNMLQ